MVMKTTEKILLNYDPEKENLLPVLKEISSFFGFISEKNAQKIADYFSLSLSQIFETASFYDFLKVKNSPQIFIKICSGTVCATVGTRKIIKEIENKLKIKIGDDFNPRIKLETASCLGHCGEGPIVIVNGQVYKKVTVSSIHEILEKYV